jgi:hypothetical protein
MYDKHIIWNKSSDLCEAKIKEVVNSTELTDLPKCLIDILVNIYGFLNENGIILTMDVKSRKEPFYKFKEKNYHGIEEAYYSATKKEVLDNLLHFVRYYIGDDGEVSIINDEIVFPDYDSKESGFDENITQTGVAMWLLEQLGDKYPCDIVRSDKEGQKVIFNNISSYIEAIDILQKYIIDEDIDKKSTRLDMVSITGKYGIRIAPKFN